MRKLFTFLCAALMSASMWAEPFVVTITEADFPTDGSHYSFTKEGVTITSPIYLLDSLHNLVSPRFTSSVGNFTRIEITAKRVALSGWTGDDVHQTWTGNASSVSTSNHSMVFVDGGSITITCTIEPHAPGPDLTWNLTDSVLTISGTGVMYDFGSEHPVPWLSSKNSITSVIISNGVTSIGGQAFSGCDSLTSVTIPSSVTSIGGQAFSHCIHLTSVTIPSSVTSIGSSAFSNCTGLTSITIPNSVTSIGDHAFSDCSGLTSIEIPNSVTSIGDHAFYYCTGLTSVTIPEGVTSIGDYAFSHCIHLTTITIPNSVTSIGDDAFYGCTGLPVINNIRYADTYLVVVTDKSLTSYTIKEGTKFIGESAFYYCINLTSITIPNSVTSIGYNAFNLCTGLTSVTIGNSVKSIGNGAFALCTGLTSITIPNSVTSIGNGAFYDCPNITSVIWNAKNCNGWNFGSQVTSFTFGDEVEVIPASLCSGMNKLSSISIPSSVTSIGESAFSGCDSLTSVTIPSSVTSIGEGAFGRCKSLTEIVVDAENPNYSSEGGVLFNKAKNTLLQCPGGKQGEYTIPSSVTGIGNYAFSGCSHLTTLTCMTVTPPTLSGNDVFYQDTALACIYVPAESVAAYKSAWSGTGKADIIKPITVPQDVDVFYQDKDGEPLDSEEIVLSVPDAPIIQGFTFDKWVVSGDLETGIIIRPSYTPNTPTSAPELTVPGNPAQKLIRNGNVYILTGDKTYTITGQMVK